MTGRLWCICTVLRESESHGCWGRSARARVKRAQPFMTELRGAPASDLWRYTADLLYVLENPVVREAFFPRGGMEYAVEPARSQDGRAILDIIERHENSVTAGYLTRWWSEAPETFAVTRDRTGSVAGFYSVFDPTRVPVRLCSQDPVPLAWLDHLDRQ